MLQECSSWASRNGAGQIFVQALNRNMLAGKSVKLERFLAVLREYIISELRFVK